MRFCSIAVILISLAGLTRASAGADSIDGRVVQLQMPAEDFTLYYVEAREVFTVKLASKSASIEARRMFIGDGEIAVELYAHSINGIYLQTASKKQGDQFKQDSRIQVEPGYKRAADLKPGDLYVTLPGIIFDLPPRTTPK